MTVPLNPGRTDASAEQTNAESFAVLEPVADGFRNYQKKAYRMRAKELLVGKAQLLVLSAAEMTVLVGGLRALGASTGGAQHGVFTDRMGRLSTDFFVNLTDMVVAWSPTDASEETFEGRDRKTGALKWTGTRVELVSDSNSQLRAISDGVHPGRQRRQVRAELCRRLEQGHERRPFRSALILEGLLAWGSRPVLQLVRQDRPGDDAQSSAQKMAPATNVVDLGIAILSQQQTHHATARAAGTAHHDRYPTRHFGQMLAELIEQDI